MDDLIDLIRTIPELEPGTLVTVRFNLGPPTAGMILDGPHLPERTREWNLMMFGLQISGIAYQILSSGDRFLHPYELVIPYTEV